MNWIRRPETGIAIAMWLFLFFTFGIFGIGIIILLLPIPGAMSYLWCRFFRMDTKWIKEYFDLEFWKTYVFLASAMAPFPVLKLFSLFMTG